MGGVGAIALTTAWTTYRWQEGKRLIVLSHLLDEIDRFNEMVAAVEILEELGSTQNSRLNLENRQEVIEALHLTRESLVCGLITESVHAQASAVLWLGGRRCLPVLREI